MYIPKNRIKTNLFTPGDEYMVKQTKEIYTGYYHSLWTGKFYSGKNQNEKNKIELVPLAPTDGLGTPDLPPSLEDINVIALFTNDPDPIVDEDEWNQGDIVTYLRITDQDEEDDQPREVPFQAYPKPTEEDYKLGVFTRYFCVKINEPRYLELDKDTYEKLKKQDANWVWELYNCFTIQWTLKGNRDDVVIANRNQTLIAQRRIRKIGLSGFLDENWLKFYRFETAENLYTAGGEFKNRRTGQEYIGFYHVHPEKGPMVGAIHIPQNHDYLDIITDNMSLNRTTQSVTVMNTSSLDDAPTSTEVYNRVINTPSPSGGGASSGGGYSGGGSSGGGY